MPHLSELARQYADRVTVLAVSDEPVATVEAFLAKPSSLPGKTWAEAMEFTVATDPDGSVKRDIFAAAGQQGIPSSFIIHRGVIEWIGHPMALDVPLRKVVAGTWDREAFRREQALVGEVTRLSRAKDWEQALARIDALLADYPDSVDALRLKWSVLLLGLHRDEAAYAVGRRLLELGRDDAHLLNELAWTTVDDAGVTHRDLDFAMEAAVRAVELTREQDAAILDTLARVHFEQGDLDQALRWQRRAVERAEDVRLRRELQRALDRYERAAAERRPEEGEGAREF